MQEFCEKLKKGISGRETIVISANCSIHYDGRAEAYLPAGDRVIILKPDKTLLVHQPNGSNPVNYMKEGSEHFVEINDKILLKSRNLKLKEFMEIKFHKIYFLHSQILRDKEKIILKGTEKDMAEKIYNNPELIEEGFKPLSREEHTKYGFIDIFGYDKENVLTVVECKRYTGDLKAVSQLRRYVEKVRKSRGLDNVKGILACPSISQNALTMLKEFGFEHRRVTAPKYLERYEKKQKKIEDF